MPTICELAQALEAENARLKTALQHQIAFTASRNAEIVRLGNECEAKDAEIATLNTMRTDHNEQIANLTAIVAKQSRGYATNRPRRRRAAGGGTERRVSDGEQRKT